MIRFFRSLLIAGLGLLAAAGALAQPPPKAPPTSAANPLAAQKAPVLDHLNFALRWYREIQTGNSWIGQESDTFFYNNERKLSAEALRAAFDSAKAEIPLIAQSNPASSTAAPASPEAARLNAAIAAAEKRLRDLTAQKAALDAQLSDAKAGGASPPGLIEQRDVVVSQINLTQARDDVLQKIASYYNSASDEGANLSMAGMVAALERSVPEIDAPPPSDEDKAKTAAAASSAVTPPAEVSSSIFARASQLYTLIMSRSQLGKLAARTKALEGIVTKLSDPLRAGAVAISQNSQQVNNEVAKTTDPAQLEALRARVDGWTVQFQELSAALVPLSQETSLLTQSDENLAEWQRSIDRQYDRIVRTLLIKTVSVLAMLLIVWGLSEFWRRATFKYVSDVRRRRQVLLTRRIITGSLMVLILVLGFISDFSSIATFAGFITAGLAVALQSVILSVAAYFFLIGRYGVKVGDRVTISGVTGEVIDVGLIRVYLMEYAGTGVDLHPTGRVVVLANSALFSSNPLFKQIPGTEYTWHEIYMPIRPEADLAYVKDHLAAVVTKVYAEYRPELEHQHNAVERLIDFHMEVPEPIPAMRFTSAGIEFVVRYPLELNRGGEVDAKMAHEVLTAIRSDKKLTGDITGMPQIRSGVH